MAQLLFLEDGHRYQLDGETLPSVSEITRFISREVYGQVMQSRLDQAAERGTEVHKACELLDKYGKVECDEEYLGYVKAYIKFLKEHKPEWEKIEWAAYNPELRYAGTIDRWGTVDGEKCIVDIKTSYQIQKVLYGAAQNLYRLMCNSQGVQVDRLLILHLQKDGTYKLVELPQDDSTAMACLTLHKALAKKRRTKR